MEFQHGHVAFIHFANFFFVFGLNWQLFHQFKSLRASSSLVIHKIFPMSIFFFQQNILQNTSDQI
jgi:hypothetical protein